MKVLITGGSGALGNSLKSVFFGAVCPNHQEMDITDSDSVNSAMLKYKPDVIIHAAALVGIRECEDNKQKAWLTNVEGTQNIVDSLNKTKKNCYLVYLSTACVFAGEMKKFYTEYDLPSPKNYYSFTKLCGELIVRQYNNCCIIRTNFAPKEQWKYPKAFTDRFGTYLFSDNAARAILEIVNKKEKGIIHVAGDKRISMYDLAILAGSKNVGKTTLAGYKGPALTVDMSLSTKRWKTYSIK